MLNLQTIRLILDLRLNYRLNNKKIATKLNISQSMVYRLLSGIIYAEELRMVDPNFSPRKYALKLKLTNAKRDQIFGLFAKEYTVREIAKITGVSVGTVYRLREELERA